MNLVASIFKGSFNEVRLKKPSNYLSISDGIPLGALVPVKVKNEILTNNNVDLRSLLPDHEQDLLTSTITSGLINVQHNTKAKIPLFVHQWMLFKNLYLYLLE